MKTPPCSGEAVQPFGSSSFTVPLAVPFTLLSTFAVTISVFSVSGTTPADGDTDTEIAGATTSGSYTVPCPVTRCSVCTSCPSFNSTPS